MIQESVVFPCFIIAIHVVSAQAGTYYKIVVVSCSLLHTTDERIGVNITKS